MIKLLLVCFNFTLLTTIPFIDNFPTFIYKLDFSFL